MNYVVALIAVALGLTVIVMGVRGTHSNVFRAITGRQEAGPADEEATLSSVVMMAMGYPKVEPGPVPQ